MSNKFIPVYDLESMNEAQRQDYIRNVCTHMGVPPELNLVMLTYLDEVDGPRRLVAYAKRGATEIIRNNRGINITDMRQEQVGGSIIWTVTAKDNNGRQEMSCGSKWIDGLSGKDLDDAIMTGQTRACRRVTLQFVGAGVLDESEVNPAKTVQTQQATPIPVPPLPTVAPASAPGKDVTSPESKYSQADLESDALEALAKRNKADEEKKQLEWEAGQQKLRDEAIAQLNAKVEEINKLVVEKPKRKYVRKPKVDFGPSEPITAKVEFHSPTGPPATLPTHSGTTLVIVPQTATIPATIPSASVPVAVTPPAPRTGLSQEEAKPYRQRYFHIVNDQLEPAGFTPKEGMGNAAKMTALASLMFPSVVSVKDLNAEQWEKYLTNLETKIATIGAAETIKYIEDAIGV